MSALNSLSRQLAPFHATLEKQLGAIKPVADIVVHVTTPLMLDWSYRQQGMPDESRKLLVGQEWWRQLASGLSSLGSYGLFYLPAKKAFQSTAVATVWGTMGSMIGYMVVRPYLTAFLATKFGIGQKPSSEPVPGTTPVVPPRTLQQPLPTRADTVAFGIQQAPLPPIGIPMGMAAPSFSRLV